MNKVFYIFRHGETDWNRERRCQGHTNIPLNQKGAEQAVELAFKMQNYPLDVVFSSDLDRALKTGAAVADKKGIPLVIEPRFREMSYGEAEGLLYDEAIEKFGAELWQKLQSFKRHNDHVGFPGGETRKLARERFHKAMLELIRDTQYRSIGISTHGGALRNILHSFLPEDHLMLPIPNCVVYKCEYLVQTDRFLVYPQPL